jgi:hypothetical protein
VTTVDAIRNVEPVTANALSHALRTGREASIRDAWWSMVDATKPLLQPSAAFPLAAVRSGDGTVAEASTVVFVPSGGNTSGVGTKSG